MTYSNRFQVTEILISRELKASIYGFGLYITTSFALIISTLVLRNYIQTIQIDGLLISTNPLCYPLYLSVLISSIYLALASSVSISRERADGTLQTLFYGPVDEISYLMAKYIQQMVLLIIILIFFTIYFYLVSLLVNFNFSFSLVKMIILMIFTGSCIISFGLFISTLTKGAKSSIILFVVITVLLLVLNFLGSFLLGMETKEISNGVLYYLRNLVGAINTGFGRLSPFSYLNRTLEAFKINTLFVYVKSIISSIIYTIVFLGFTTWSFKRKGVRPL